MSKSLHATRLNMLALAQEGQPLIEITPLSQLERLAQEAPGLAPDAAVNWQAQAELRTGSGTEPDVWLHLQAKTSVPLTCQRCMGVVATPLEVDQWYRFVATEDIAMAQDDDSEEDLLVMTPQFDLLAVLEDELLMALPLVPMHDECPVAPVLQVGEEEITDEVSEKPNPFALLAQLKKDKS
ncbi:MAG: YceD family protein [Polaromonas sp.]|nr:YceD family protein [Polaromonas sp.]